MLSIDFTGDWSVLVNEKGPQQVRNMVDENDWIECPCCRTMCPRYAAIL